jgi:hypothetical protein
MRRLRREHNRSRHREMEDEFAVPDEDGTLPRACIAALAARIVDAYTRTRMLVPCLCRVRAAGGAGGCRALARSWTSSSSSSGTYSRAMDMRCVLHAWSGFSSV